MKIKTRPILIGVVLLYLAAPKAFAVVPTPDGGYPGGNTAEGQAALLSLTTGGFNTAVGLFSLRGDTSGSFNTGVGTGALLANTIGEENTAIGLGALLSNTDGVQNTATGAFALFSNNGFQNTADGDRALFSNTTGNANTANGTLALLFNTIGNGNTASGYQALWNNTTGSSNIALGVFAGANTTGDFNVNIGNPGVAGESRTVRIGTGDGVHTRMFFAGVRGVTTGQANAIPVLIDVLGQLGTTSSSARFKKEIKPMDKTSESVLALKPVTFHYKSDKTNTPQFGLIAEEVAKVNPGLVVCDENGEIYTVRYDAVNAMLLNEFLKEHSKVEEQDCKMQEQERQIQKQETTIAQLRNEMETVVARLKDQDSKIRKVADQVQMDRRGAQLVATP